MKNYLQTKHLINISDVDVNYNLRLDYMLNCLQDVTTFHSFELKVDRETMVKESNAFWVLSKVKLVFDKLPKWNEEITVKTYPTTVTPIRFFREFLITAENGVVINGNSEWCVLDATTKGIRRSNSVNYPLEMEHLPPNPKMPPFCKIKESIDSENLTFTYKIMHTDIDCNKHTNNVTYAKMILNAFTPTEFEKLAVKGIEINFLNQTYYGDSVDVYKKQVDGGYYIEGKIQDKSIFISKLYI